MCVEISNVAEEWVLSISTHMAVLHVRSTNEGAIPQT